MRLKVQRTTKETHIVTIGITCNFCGKLHNGDDIDMEPITEFEISPGYGSRYDCERYQLDICDDCLEELLHKLKVRVSNDSNM